jgi:hypothetical protein
MARVLSNCEVDFVSNYEQHNLVHSELFDTTSVTDSKMEEDIPYPLSAQILAQYQKEDKVLLRNVQRYPQYFSKEVEGSELIHFHQKIYVPKPLRTKVLDWTTPCYAIQVTNGWKGQYGSN